MRVQYDEWFHDTKRARELKELIEYSCVTEEERLATGHYGGPEGCVRLVAALTDILLERGILSVSEVERLLQAAGGVCIKAGTLSIDGSQT